MLGLFDTRLTKITKTTRLHRDISYYHTMSPFHGPDVAIVSQYEQTEPKPARAIPAQLQKEKNHSNAIAQKPQNLTAQKENTGFEAPKAKAIHSISDRTGNLVREAAGIVVQTLRRPAAGHMREINTNTDSEETLTIQQTNNPKDRMKSTSPYTRMKKLVREPGYSENAWKAAIEKTQAKIAKREKRIADAQNGKRLKNEGQLQSLNYEVPDNQFMSYNDHELAEINARQAEEINEAQAKADELAFQALDKEHNHLETHLLTAFDHILNGTPGAKNQPPERLRILMTEIFTQS